MSGVRRSALDRDYDRVSHAQLPTKVCPCGSKWFRDGEGNAQMLEHDLDHPFHDGLSEKR